MSQIETVGATSVRDGDIVINYGYRCRASQCHDSVSADGQAVRTFVLTSEPNSDFPNTLPGGYNGGRYGGSSGATYGREVTA